MSQHLWRGFLAVVLAIRRAWRPSACDPGAFARLFATDRMSRECIRTERRSGGSHDARRAPLVRAMVAAAAVLLTAPPAVANRAPRLAAPASSRAVSRLPRPMPPQVPNPRTPLDTRTCRGSPIRWTASPTSPRTRTADLSGLMGPPKRSEAIPRTRARLPEPMRSPPSPGLWNTAKRPPRGAWTRSRRRRGEDRQSRL